MEIRVGGPGQELIALSTTMRTPGHDFELAAGFVLAEGVVERSSDIKEVKYCDGRDAHGQQRFNIVTVRTARPVDVKPRRSTVTSSCGVCGAASLADLATCSVPLPVDDNNRVPAEVLVGLPDAMRRKQKVFDQTGAVHAACLLDRTGVLGDVREDVGRHNAVDKVIGRELLAGRLPGDHASVLVVSGRASFEIVQKAVRARIPIIVAVSAPTSLAVDAADQHNVTLLGFTRNGEATMYTGAARVSGC